MVSGYQPDRLLGNAFVLPRMIGTLEDRLARSCDCRIFFESARYIPGRGLTLRSLGFRKACKGCPTEADPSGHTTSSLDMDVARARIRLTFRLLRTMLEEINLSFPKIDPINLNSMIFDLLDSVVGSEILPRAIDLQVVSVAYFGNSLPSSQLYFDRVQTIWDSKAESIVVSATRNLVPEIRITAQFDYGNRRLSAAIRGSSIQLDRSGNRFVESGVLRGELTLSSSELEAVSFNGDLDIVNLQIYHPSIAAAPLSFDVGYTFQGYYDSDTVSVVHEESRHAGELIFTGGELQIGGIGTVLLPSIEGFIAQRLDNGELSSDWRISPSILNIEFMVPITPLDKLLAAIPGAIAGPVADTTFLGSLSWNLDATIPLDEVSRMAWQSNVVLEEFAITRIPSTINPYHLNESIVLTIDNIGSAYRRSVRIPPSRPASDGWWILHSEHTQSQIDRFRAEEAQIRANRPDVEADPMPEPPTDPTYRYVRLDDMSPWIVRAILTAEDGDFFFYGGVNPVTLADAIEINLDAGEIRFGASTITMQLAKMLYLDQERTFARKLQEVFLVYLIEHQVPVAKDRILELYLNLAEFGPGIIGIFEASGYYFEKDPRDLSAGEAAWLASILPAPKVYHRYFEEGSIPDEWFARLIDLFDIMLERGRMTRSEYDSAIDVRPEFRRIVDPTSALTIGRTAALP